LEQATASSAVAASGHLGPIVIVEYLRTSRPPVRCYWTLQPRAVEVGSDATPLFPVAWGRQA